MVAGLTTSGAHARTPSSGDRGAGPDQTFRTYVEVLSSDYVVEYGDKFALEGHASYVRNGVGQAAPPSTWWVDRQFNGSTEWDRLRTDGTTQPTNPSEVANIRAHGNATYKMTYVENTNGTDVWQYGTDTIYQWVSRDLNDGTHRENGAVFLDGVVEPDWERRKLVLTRATCAGCAQREVRKFETDHRSRYEVRLPRPDKGTYYYQAFIPDSTRFIASFTRVYKVSAK